jgi:lipopolysaccharide export system permease protein
VSWTLMRAVGRLYLAMFAGVLAAVLVIFLVGDFADRLGAYLDHPVADVAELYWNKLLVALQQLAPAAMLLSGGAAVSVLRKRGEWTAMRALGLSRAVIVAPVAAVTLSCAVALVAFDELVVTGAGPKVDAMMVSRFHRWGDFRLFYTPQQWFRLDKHLVQVRGGEAAGVLSDVSLYELDQGFRVLRRLDVAELRHLGGVEWEATGVSERRFPGPGEAPLTHHEALRLSLPGSRADSFRVRPGRPEFMPTSVLRTQLAVRAQVGLPTQPLVLALHNRFAYPATGFAATMLALALALRPGRRGHLTLALVEGLVVTMALFGLLLVGKVLVVADRVPAPVAAWAPTVALLLVSGAMWWRDERPRRGASWPQVSARR